jgi:hypothetical protein
MEIIEAGPRNHNVFLTTPIPDKNEDIIKKARMKFFWANIK